jgi:hypothetical protein
MKVMKIINVSIPPIITPETAHFLFVHSFKGTRLTIRAMGEPNMISLTPRSLSHPGCINQKQINVRIGTSERPNPVLPSQFKFLFIGCPSHQVPGLLIAVIVNVVL